jgi:hypothetical protein
MIQDWDEQNLGDLGKMSDQSLANRMKLHNSTVRKKRLLLGIPPYKTHRAEQPWMSHEISLLGSLPDKTLAAKLDRPLALVQQARIYRGIPVCRTRPLISWSDSDLHDLGKLTDSVIASRKGISKGTVAAKRKALSIPPALPRGVPPTQLSLLGTRADADVAKVIDRPVRVVKEARISRGIAAYTHPNRRYVTPARSSLPLTWSEMQSIDQHQFFALLSNAYRESTTKNLTLRKLAKLSLWSVQHLRSWLTPKVANNPMPQTVRHHLWLAVIVAI